MLARVSTKSELAKAIGYSARRAGQALTRYVDDGRIEIDNNAAERALRGVGLGRKNYCSWARTPAASALRRSTA